ncbi:MULTISPECIES: hypothetical protein [unclassified Rothia (in: high G+C Gram-positive bacteria)]|uniref:hypothetical protein n=1 Tax=unclassified Rothia (in: high G+C Gram-positive bacteria) TaxID=2689056 RepID=UPI00195D6032|nr:MULTISPECIES: hypothetical protein [unclassified Rothia (in: high G+C Gram-positive bacteria)]MBM7050892.1 hypothetical protein [Rothia sp. ZJ1223]QRZ62368.1 hypothetical protein JR346_04570 [Rothia sp. ZJ932]
MKKFRPRNFTAVGLSITWLLISLYFISQGLMVGMWSVFAVIALCIGAAAVWVLFNDTVE